MAVVYFFPFLELRKQEIKEAEDGEKEKSHIGGSESGSVASALRSICIGERDRMGAESDMDDELIFGTLRPLPLLTLWIRKLKLKQKQKPSSGEAFIGWILKRNRTCDGNVCGTTLLPCQKREGWHDPREKTGKKAEQLHKTEQETKKTVVLISMASGGIPELIQFMATARINVSTIAHLPRRMERDADGDVGLRCSQAAINGASPTNQGG
ncbi:hypothetical protein MUK42_32544 [Musa troglodytarum]|uniref:Uncharacterized protein n=1 Tax=Musa troglodytarum TaxID=320322 RepID=A0A9E7HFL9_9LILI|nr:hypothetical protein MUK42_32544 [Musa troglodytarum]